nr:reverse transcriptase domain-containing protein [Tanacetum cinerariifolium]
MSDSEDSTVTYTTVSSSYKGRSGDVSPGVDGPPVMPEDPYAYVVAAFQALPPPDYVPGLEEPEQEPPSPIYIPYVPEPVYPEYIPSEDGVLPAEEQPLPATASPTIDSPGYIPESYPNEDLEDDDDKDPEEDPADYPVDHDVEEEEEEPSGDDADEEDEEQDKDDDDEEEEHPASADSIPLPPALCRFLAMPIPPPSPLTPLSSPLPQIPSPPLPASPHILPIPLLAASPPLQLLSSDCRADRPEVTLPPRKRLSIVHCPGYEAGESSVVAAARPIEGRRTDCGFVDSGGKTEIFQRVEALVDDSQYNYETGRLIDQEARFSREAWAHSMGLGLAVHFELQGTFQKVLSKTKKNNNNRSNQVGTGNAQARVYAVGNAGTNPDANTITSTFLLNNCYASMLFDTSADRSFVSTAFSSQFDIAPTVLDHDYVIELVDGRIVGVNTVIHSCTLNFLNLPFNIDLMPVEMGSFDVIIGMDWLSRYQAVIVCADNIVRIPWGRKTLIFHGDGSNPEHETQLNIISCAKTHKYMLKGCQVFLAHFTTKEAEGKSKKKRLENVPIVRDFPEAFLKDLPSLPPSRPV